MVDPLHDRDSAEVLRQVHEAAGPYLGSLGDRLVYDAAATPLLAGLADPAGLAGLTDSAGLAGPAGDGRLPEQGIGSAAALRALLDTGIATATHSAGPRFFHFVIGGSTPAALAADWTTSLLDQNAAFRASSQFATAVETVALRWLRELFGLPAHFGGALVASATYANFTGLGAATQWWGERHGVDVAVRGLSGLPRMPVLASGLVHPSDRKALQMLGHGRQAVEVYATDGVGRVDLAALDRRLTALSAPAVLIASAGDVNAGHFDPIDEFADLAERHGAWLHVDGAFGLFAALSPRTARLVRGVERADSIAGDGHKWLNVPYESGFALLREPDRLASAFGMPGASYLPGKGNSQTAPAGPASPGSASSVEGGVDYAVYGPESSRRARSLPIWATLAAYGRDGHRAMVERHLDLAQRLAGLVDETPELERLADVVLTIVCFRARPDGVPEAELDAFNRRLAAALLADGRVYAGSTVYDGKVALRPAIVNWRTTEADIDLLVAVVRELTARLAA